MERVRRESLEKSRGSEEELVQQIVRRAGVPERICSKYKRPKVERN